MKRLLALVLFASVALSGCSFGSSTKPRTYRADFTRAVQIFPAVKVRVLGVEVGHVVGVKNSKGAVQVTFEVTDPTVQIPQGVKATLVPVSLLGERYIQLFPAYRSGPTLANGSTIPLSRTAVPAEPDELIRSLQNYLGGLDPKTVTEFVQNAARTLEGDGGDINNLLHYGADLISTLDAKSDDINSIIVELNKLTTTLSTRQQAVAALIDNYNAVANTLNTSQNALEGTVEGLNSAAAQLASLLLDHQATLEPDVETLTKTGQTLDRNVDSLARTGKYATLLFQAASRAVDYDHDWLRLGNQGQELGALILMRLEQRLMEICLGLPDPLCINANYWATHVPQLFCFLPKGCGTAHGSAAAALLSAVESRPKLKASFAAQADAQDTTIETLVSNVLSSTVGNAKAFEALL